MSQKCQEGKSRECPFFYVLILSLGSVVGFPNNHKARRTMEICVITTLVRMQQEVNWYEVNNKAK